MILRSNDLTISLFIFYMTFLDKFDLYDSLDREPSRLSPICGGVSPQSSSREKYMARALEFPGSDDDSDAPSTLTASIRK